MSTPELPHTSDFEKWVWTQKHLALSSATRYRQKLDQLKRLGIDCDRGDPDEQLTAKIPNYWGMGRTKIRGECRRAMALWREYLASQEAAK